MSDDSSEPEQDDGAEDDAGAVVAGVFVVAGGDAAPLFEPAEGTLDDVACLVGLGIERRRSAAAAAAGGAVRGLVGAFWDDGADPASAQGCPGGGVGVGPVRDQHLRSGPGPGMSKTIVSLPGSLFEAIQELEKSELVKETLGDHIFNQFIANKKIEWNRFRTHVSEFEIKNYLPKL